jgi:hypothetical protein
MRALPPAALESNVSLTKPIRSSGFDARLEAPPASRLRPARWRDARLIGGVAMIVLCTLVGSRVVASAGTTHSVWRVKSNLAAGSTLSASDLESVQVNLAGAAANYVSAESPLPAGAVLARDLSAGELVPLSAVSAKGAAAPQRLVTLPVTRLHFPPGLAHGERVDVYSTPHVSGSTTTIAPTKVLDSVVVSSVDDDSSRFGGDSQSVGVIVAVAPDQVSRVVAAVQSGDIDVVRVPGVGQ